jgi:hypothetical protein
MSGKKKKRKTEAIEKKIFDPFHSLISKRETIEKD